LRDNCHGLSRTIIYLLSVTQRKNITVREIPSGDENTSTEETRVVSIVDWEVAGWYPGYWEYAAAFFAFKWEDDWLERIEEVIDA
jgi:hypothetical protein